MSSPSNPLPEGLKPLSESEIQERLYGGYRGLRCRPSPLRDDPSPPKPALFHKKGRKEEGKREWTGAEILYGELRRLRSELLALKKEREQIRSQMRQVGPPEVRRSELGSEPGGRTINLTDLIPQGGQAPEAPEIGNSARWVSPQGRTPATPAWRFWAAGWVLLVGFLAYPLGARFLQASPPVWEDSAPYTVQVAVYDVEFMAQRAVEHLRSLGYEAFRVGMRRQNGRSRFRIYVGSFLDRRDAEALRLRLASDDRFQDFKDAFVRLY